MLLACAALAAGLSALSAKGQATQPEYRMDAQGNWAETRSPDPNTEEAFLARARKALAEERPAEARSILDDWLGRNERSTSTLLPEALTLRGDALTALGYEFDALYDYERVIKEFPSTESYIASVERELDIGTRYLAGLRRKFVGMRLLPNEDVGEELLIRVQERMPGSRIAERAGIELADYYYANHNLPLAAEAYDLFVQNYPNSQYAMKARQRRIYSTIGRYKGPEYDGSALLDSKILVRRFANRYPAEAQSAGLDDALVVRLDESGAEHLLETAAWYIRREDFVSAQYLLRRLIKEFPRSAAAGHALDLMKARGWNPGMPDAAFLKRAAPAPAAPPSPTTGEPPDADDELPSSTKPAAPTLPTPPTPLTSPATPPASPEVPK